MKKKNNETTQLIEKYTDCGWKTLSVPKGSQNDLIAQHNTNSTLHFIQLIVDKNDPRLTGIPHSTFVQNAFSNGAIPVHAISSTYTKGPNKDKLKISLKDANTGNKIIIRKRKIGETKITKESK